MEVYIFNFFNFDDVSFVISNVTFDPSIYVFFSKNFSFFVEYTSFDEIYNFNYDSFFYSNNKINKDFLIYRWEKTFDFKNFINFNYFYHVIFNKA